MMRKFKSVLVAGVMFGSIITPVTVSAANEPAVSTTQQTSSAGFVKASGTQFIVDGHPFYFAGANSYDLFTYGDGSNTSSTEDIETKYMYKDKIDSIMSQMAQDGIKVVRTWGFSNENWHGFETAKGVYNEAQFMLFDYIMESANKHGIKIIITLENYWDAYGGIDRKLQWEGLSGGNHTARAQFFTNTKTRAHYKAYAEHFINRINHYTGVAYKDDPTIFAWDLMNEPRYQDAPVNENKTGLTLRAWVDEMGAYIKSLDPNHMVTAGIEGHETRYGFGGDEGNPFIYIQQSPYIDFTSAHPYPDEYWANLTPEKNADIMRMWINDSHNVIGKPFVAGEFNSHNNKDLYWPSVFGVIEEKGAAGGLLWEYNSKKLSDFTIVHGDPILTYFKAHSDRMAAKNNVAANYVTPAQATFDKKEGTQADISLTLSLLSGNTLTAIKNGASTLVKGTDYTLSGNTVIIKKSYLAALPQENATLVFDISSGYDPSATINIIDSGILNSELNSTEASFDKNVARQNDVSVSFTSNGNTFVGIKNGSAVLTSGTDYTVSGNTVAVKKSYLANQAVGTVNLTFDFNRGTDPVLKITVADTSGQDIIDNFESYAGSASSLQSAYVKNGNGNSLTVGLDNHNSESAYGMSYAYTIGSPNYAGVTRSIGNKSWSGFKGLSFWLKPDGSNRELTIQIKETGGEYWETRYNLSSATASTVTLPFSSFTHPSWYSGGNGTLDLGSIAEYSLYIDQGQGNAGNGTLYFDNIKLAEQIDPKPPIDKQAPTVPANLQSPAKTSASVNLTWSASSDNVGVQAYDIYNGTTLAGSTSDTSYTITGLSANTAYSFTVKARDAAGNVSDASSTLNVTTDTTNQQYPAWDINKQYVGGEIVTYNGKLWKAQWWTNREVPGTTGQWGVWKEYTN
ncbi:X2-like carbohydrate binding domain-containing protein [Paenibacillus sp. SI8]|uniref:X2-like carbohydrate binding domain-containing protein n=1 Tax=unclassified Paenibacillus TaxID=185978 RepID=UPI0034660250